MHEPADTHDTPPNDGGIRPETRAFHHALTELVRIHQYRDRDRICCHDISVTQWHALGALVAGGGRTLNELAAELRLDKSTASRVIETLVGKGHVAREPVPENRRAVRIDVTPSGRALHGRIEGEILAEEEALLEEFGVETRRRMTRLLEEIARAAAARIVGDGADACCAPTPVAITRSPR